MGSLYESMGGAGTPGPSWWEQNIGNIVVTAIILFFLGGMWWIFDSMGKAMDEAQEQATITVSTTDAGKVESLTVQQGNFSKSTTTTINTTKGTFVVYGRFSFMKGARARLETRANNYQYLCISGMNQCNRLAR